jgi:uncharacterized lipoprotein YbaY
MLPRLLALLCLSSLLAACSSTPPAPALATTVKPKPLMVAPEPLPNHLRELSGQLLGVPTAGEAELALLLVDSRDRPVQLLASSRLSGNGAALPFSLCFSPLSIPAGQRLELRGRVSQAGILTLRLPARAIQPTSNQALGALQLVPAP